MSDAAAQEAFCRREWPRLLGALTLHCGDRLVAEEIAQEALARAVERWRQVEAMAAPGAWVHRVAMNLAASRFRRAAAERRALRRAERPPSADPQADTADAVTVRHTVARLPRKQRTALALRYALDWPVADVAAYLGCSEAAARQHTSRGLAALRGHLAVEGRSSPREAGHDG